MIPKKYFDFVKKFFFPLLLVSVFFVSSSVFWTTESIFSYTELSDVKFGFPIAFVSKNLTGQYDFNDFTHATRYISPMQITFGPSIEKIIQLGILIIPLVVSYIYSVIIEIMVAGNISFFSASGTTFSWYLFFFNIVIVQLILVSVLFVAHSIFPSTQKFFRFLSVKYVLLCIVFFMLVISTVSFFFTKWMTPQHGQGIYTPPPTRVSTMLPTKLPAEKP